MTQDIGKWFGSVEKCMLTLFKVAFGGQDWVHFYELLSHTGTFEAIVFVGFVCFMQIAVFNIVTSIYVEMTTRLAAPCTHTVARFKRQKEREEARELRRLVCTLDPENTGKISAWQFKELVENVHMRNCFAVLGLDLRNTEHFFDMLGFVNGDSYVDIDAFVEGCLRMKGAATGLAQQSLLMEAKLLRRAQRETCLVMMERLDALSEWCHTTAGYSPSEEPLRSTLTEVEYASERD
eukprot:UN3611